MKSVQHTTAPRRHFRVLWGEVAAMLALTALLVSVPVAALLP